MARPWAYSFLPGSGAFAGGGLARVFHTKAARGADRHLQILEVGGQAPDHPVHPAIPETRYLKAYFCRVNESLK